MIGFMILRVKRVITGGYLPQFSLRPMIPFFFVAAVVWCRPQIAADQLLLELCSFKAELTTITVQVKDT